jgi:predicted HAD superfamily Cof-like phosphohydrolase
MPNVFRDQEKFMKACGQTTDVWNEDQFNLYVNLIDEEFKELKEAIAAGNRVEILDALEDIMVVTAGAMHSAGFNGEDGWREVMSTNFAKIDRETGMVRKRDDGKIMKPLGWKPPQLEKFLNKSS